MFDTSNIKLITIESKTVARMSIGSGSSGKEIALTCKVTYNGNGNTSGSVPSPTEGHYSETVTLATNSGSLAKTDYDFIGWNTAADGSGTTYSAGGNYTLNGDVTLYACWRIKYTLTFKANMASGQNYYISGQTGNATSKTDVIQKISQGSQIGTLPTYGSGTTYTYTLSSVNYTVYIEGWYKETSCTNKISTTTVPTGNTTYYAKWKMTANIGISSAVTIPKFASSVSWTCYSNGGSRSAINRTGSSGGLGWQMAAPGANRNGDSYTWSGCGGKAITALSDQSMTLNGVTRTVSTPGEGGIWDYHIKVLADLVGTGRGTIKAGSKTYSSGNYKVIIYWPDIGQNKSGYLTIAFYYANSLKANVSTKYRIDVGDSDNNYPRSYTVETRTYSGTFASGTYGAEGAYGCASYHTSSVSRVKVAAASGSGYSRTVTVNA